MSPHQARCVLNEAKQGGRHSIVEITEALRMTGDIPREDEGRRAFASSKNEPEEVAQSENER